LFTGAQHPLQKQLLMKPLFIVIALLLQETDARNPLEKTETAMLEKILSPNVIIGSHP